MGKPQARRVPSDDCAVTIDGEVYFPHEGEWVEVLPGLSAGEIHAYRTLQEIGPQLAAAAGETDETAQRIRLTDDAFEGLLRGLCERVMDWSWTNHAGRPLPKPELGNPEPLRRLEAEELVWMIGVVMGRTPSEEGKGSRRSPTISSDSARRPTPTR